ncbi:hypothetical protein Bca4012_089438 [Brassica carinata]
MAKTRGGGRVGSRRSSRRTQGLKVQVASATTLASQKKNLALTPTRRSSRIKNLAVQDDEVEVVTPEDDEIEDVTPEDDDVAGEDKKDDKEDSEKDGEACLTGHEEQEEDIENENDDNEKGNEEEALNVKEDEVTNAQDDEIPSTDGVQLPADEVKEKNRRGPTKMRIVAENPNEKVAVTFNDFGDHVGPGSVTLSSFLGPLVREHVPGRFNLQKEWQKACIFKQLGSLWRAGKSKLVSQVRAARTAAERLDLKPINVPSIHLWNSWVRSKTTTTFTEISNRYKELRKKSYSSYHQPQQKKSQDPSKVSRSKVWIAGHTHANGRPVKPQFAETIEQIQSLDSQMDSTSAADNIREDVVTRILGKDKNGRVRGFGRGVTTTKLAFLQSRDAKIADMASEIEELKKSNGETETSETSAGFKGVRVQILDWFEAEDVVVGEGEFCSDFAQESSRFSRCIHGKVCQSCCFYIINEKIAWPILKFKVMASTTTDATPTKTPAKKTTSPTKPIKKKAVASLVPPEVQSRSVFS